MRTEVADNWIAVVDRFAASSLRMIFVGQTGLRMHFADFLREALRYREEM